MAAVSRLQSGAQIVQMDRRHAHTNALVDVTLKIQEHVDKNLQEAAVAHGKEWKPARGVEAQAVEAQAEGRVSSKEQALACAQDLLKARKTDEAHG
ncbi:MAG: hypothetical protein HYT88_05775 [Candidatus Omnitrophica bacterium]|nr:hypothetical protein [Candidatus Omnitrophota bacterium]